MDHHVSPASIVTVLALITTAGCTIHSTTRGVCRQKLCSTRTAPRIRRRAHSITHNRLVPRHRQACHLASMVSSNLWRFWRQDSRIPRNVKSCSVCRSCRKLGDWQLGMESTVELGMQETQESVAQTVISGCILQAFCKVCTVPHLL